MRKFNAKRFMSKMTVGIKKNAPDICMIVGIVGGVVAGGLAIKATPKALQLIAEEETRRIDKICKEDETAYFDANNMLHLKNDTEIYDPNLPFVDKVKVAWKQYIPAISTGAVAIGSVLASRSLAARRTTALAAAYKLSETALKEYKDAVVENLGEEKAKEITHKIVEKKIEQAPVVENRKKSTVEVDEFDEEQWFYEPFLGKRFKSTIHAVRHGIDEANYRMKFLGEDYVSLNYVYGTWNLKTTDVGDYLGWNISRGDTLDIYLDDAIVMENGKSATIVEFKSNPTPNYQF